MLNPIKNLCALAFLIFGLLSFNLILCILPRLRRIWGFMREQWATEVPVLDLLHFPVVRNDEPYYYLSMIDETYLELQRQNIWCHLSGQYPPRSNQVLGALRDQEFLLQDAARARHNVTKKAKNECWDYTWQATRKSSCLSSGMSGVSPKWKKGWQQMEKILIRWQVEPLQNWVDI
jgi:hypothetical protein